MIQTALRILFGTKYERDIREMQPIVTAINAHEERFQAMDDQALAACTGSFRARLESGETTDDLLPEAFAVVREASRRILGMRHYDVQMMGGIALHKGTIAEMKTGEGKTLTSTLAVYLNALPAQGVHVVTVNDYLAKRDAEWMGPLYRFLGLSVGVIQSNMPHNLRRQAYAADITYGTNNEFGFDYLRDNMVEHASFKVQRGHFYGIVDEVDSILIDEARTPLIISGPAEQDSASYGVVNRIIPGLQRDADFEIDEKARNITLTELGVAKCEKLLNVENLYEPQNVELVHHVHQALKAHYLFQRDVDYVVQNGEVIIVDEFTGRLMEGRRYSDGLHQALEAKERVEIKQENQTLATITFQNYFRMYKKLAGMTGTADTEAEEFKKIYNLDVVVLPPNKPMLRKDHPDRVYRTMAEKFEAIVELVVDLHTNGQPVLLGTVSIENSEKLSRMLKAKGVPHAVLNAKYHEQEAEIVAMAGQKGRVTIATNMAGRGTDIVLGEGVREAGGLYIVGSERHESRRIDNQLRGRSGRQGDPGASTFFLSLEDDLMRIFGSDRIAPLMQRLGMQQGESIEHPLLSRAIERAQKRVEGHNFEIRKHLLEYDDVMNKQRTFIYSIRNEILDNRNVSGLVDEFLDDTLDTRLALHIPNANASQWDLEGLISWLQSLGHLAPDENEKQLRALSLRDINEKIVRLVRDKYAQKRSQIGTENANLLERMVLLQVIDQKWKDHLYAMDQLREGIWTIGYAERNPLVEYRFKAFRLFEDMVALLKEEAVTFLFLAQIEGPLREEAPAEYKPAGKESHNQVQNFTGRELAAPKQPGESKAASTTAGGSSARRSSRRRR